MENEYKYRDSGSLEDLKQNYYVHLKKLNPNIESTYHSSIHYYNAEILPLMPSDKGARILDLGCGFGHLIRFLLENGFENTGGLELDRRLYEECQTHIGNRAAFIENESAQNYLNDHKDTFDVIIATDVIEHFSLEDAIGLLMRIRNSLKLDGRVILRTPNMANIFGGYSRYMDLTHQIGFTEHSLSQLMVQAGFENTQLHLPDWHRHPKSLKFKWSTWIQRWLFSLQDRSVARCFDKNIIMWAVKH